MPMRFFDFSNGMYIIKTDRLNSELLGSKVLKINSNDVSKIRTSVYPYISGTNEWKKFKAINFVNAPQFLNEVGLGEKKSIQLTLLKNNDTPEVTLNEQNIKDNRLWFESQANLIADDLKEQGWRLVKTKGHDNLRGLFLRLSMMNLYKFSFL